MIGDSALDAALAHIKSTASRLDICTTSPDSYAATMSASLGYTQTFTVSAPRDCEGGRCVHVGGIGEGTTTKGGTPSHWVLTGMGAVLASGRITSGRQVVPGIAFRLPELDIELRREV